MMRGRNPRRFPNQHLGLSVAAVCFAMLVCFGSGVASAQKNAATEQDLATWRAQHAAELQKPDGWLALAGLVWLEPGDNSMGSSGDSKARLRLWIKITKHRLRALHRRVLARWRLTFCARHPT